MPDAAAAPRGQAPCSKRLLKDWIINGIVQGRYPAWCYDAALARASNERGSNVGAEIHKAIRRKKG